MKILSDRQGTTRDSGIELLKIISIFIIVISHVIQTLGYQQNIILSDGSNLNLTSATTNITCFILMLCRYFGPIGNDIFLICSAWFLCDSKRVKLNKFISLLLDVWIISIVIMVLFYVTGTDLSATQIIHSFFPTTFENNWYVTCYLMIYAIHPLLNIVIDRITQKQHLLIVAILGMLYCVIGTIKSTFFYFSAFVVFIVIYFLIAYIKRYMPRLSDSIKMNLVLFIIGAAGLFLMVLATNIIGLKFDAAKEFVLSWKNNQNPFIILICLSAFNLFRQIKFKNKGINLIASVTLFIYIIHENLLVRTYLRPSIWTIINKNFGYEHLILQSVLFAFCLFVISAIIGLIYKFTIQKISIKISNGFSVKLEKMFDTVYRMIEKIE